MSDNNALQGEDFHRKVLDKSKQHCFFGNKCVFNDHIQGPEFEATMPQKLF